MKNDITKIYEEYFEQLLFCRFFVAEQLQHNGEMGRCGENILKRQLSKRFAMLEFVTGIVVANGIQSPQCDILVCRKNMFKRPLEGGIFLVDPRDCLMVIEVKGNMTLSDLSETNRKNQFFKANEEMQHIQLALFAFKTRVGKKTLMEEFGYQYSRAMKAYIQSITEEEKKIDLFICLHRDNLNKNVMRDKQVLFIKDKQEANKYTLDNDYPVIKNLLNYMQSLQD